MVDLIRVNAIWHAVHSIHAGWSTPEQVYVSKHALHWNSDFAEVVTIHGSVHGLAADIAAPAALVHIETYGSRAAVTRVPTYVAAYTSLTGASSEQLVAVYMAADTIKPAVPNSVFARAHSRLGWSPATQIQRSENGAATSIFVRSAQDVTHAVWIQSHSGELSPDGWRTAVSRDHGRSWTPPRTIAREPMGLRSFGAAVHPADCMRVLYLTAQKGGANALMRHWYISESSWTAGSGISLSNVGTIATAADDTALYVVGLGAEAKKDTPMSSVFWLNVGR